MKRRSFSLLGGCSTAALALGLGPCKQAQADTPDASLLGTTLTPLGAERAGNADGSIPAWTGAYTTIPNGWTASQPMPDMFASDPKVVTIDSSNMAQYKDKLTDGMVYMMTNFGWHIDVYPTHRTAGAPQWVYDNIVKNVASAKLNPGGGRLGFSGGFGGIPFPIPDQSDPLAAGAQIIWNHLTRWQGETFITKWSGATKQGGQFVLESSAQLWFTFPYYKKSGTLADYDGLAYYVADHAYAPGNQDGFEVVEWVPTNPFSQPMQSWELLAGQGRVRKLPQAQYDIPESEVNGLNNYDEAFLFQDSPDRYDWKLIGKAEKYILYNNNAQNFITPKDFGDKFLNPDISRFELHRVWIIEGTVHPGDRNVLARRRFYIDEDNWTIAHVEAYDAQDNIWKIGYNYVQTRPDLPGTPFLSYIIYNVQQSGYVCQSIDATLPLSQRVWDYTTPPEFKLYDPNAMQAQASF